MISHSCYHLVEDDKLLCSKCKRILTHFTERVNEGDYDSDNSDSDSDSDELVSSLYSSGSVVCFLCSTLISSHTMVLI